MPEQSLAMPFADIDTKEARHHSSVGPDDLAVLQEVRPGHHVALAPTEERREVVTPALEEGDMPTTSKWEIRSWYLYYVGANGLALFNFGPTAFQNLLAQAAGDSGLLYFAGRERDVNSIVLLANGMSFAIQAALFLIIGAYADFGTGRRWVLLVWSIIAYAIGFAWLGVHDAEKWKIGVGLYVVGLIAYQLTLTYWTAAFPSLARNTAHIKESRVAYEKREISQQELDKRDEMERSRLSNVGFWVQSCGELVILAIIIAIMFGVRVDASPSNNNWGLSVLIAFATACWLALSVPWFLVEKKRPGMRIPPGKNIVTVGLWQLGEALTQIWHLKQSLIYLAGYFLLGDSLNTTVTVIATLQNQVVNYNTLTITYLLIVGIGTQALGIGGFWLIQKRFDLGAKTMFNAVMVFIILLDGWGMVGNWTDRFGFKNVWEVWLYQAYYGLVVCPWYSYSQIMISSVTPRGHEFLFFSVFNIIGKASSFIGPLISSAIIDATPGGQNNSAPFYFLFALSLLSAVGIWVFLDLEKSAREQEAFLVQEKERVYGEDSFASKEKLAAAAA
ncbi:Major facilitator superfamily domain, general substrate transporter [Metarhizium rileyi]|uniref:Autophagy-related protein n=1 Tax=Metarhizium rileyi (strain RCEF 4871) TaxID=1649241 RepID=A0A167BHV1_METRR|nr:Major facilitator superfamily domain, general substrate transporter [Metarhizium rileyi RCEF 4871]